MGRGSEPARGLSRTVKRRLAEVERCDRRGESLTAYAQRTDQSVYGFYEAKRVARRAGVLPPHREEKTNAQRGGGLNAAPRFVEAVLATPSERASGSGGLVAWRLRLPGGAVLESTTPLDPASLDRLVAGLSGRAS